MVPASTLDRAGAAPSGGWRGWRDRLLSSPRFQRWAARFPLTRPVARRQASDLFDLVAGFVYSQVVLAVVRLGLLDRLRDGPLPAERLLAGAALAPEAAECLLKAAAALNLLESRGSAGWGLGARGASLLGNPGVLAMVEHHAVLYGDLADPLAMLRAPRGSTALARYWPYAVAVQPGAVPQADTSAYTELMAASQSLVADEILDAYPVQRHRRVLDVGGGDGSFLRAVGRRAPAVRLMLFDLPGVATRARAAFSEAGMADRADVHAGDFTRDPLPEGADLVTLVRVLHDHDDDRALALLRAVRRALGTDGTLVVAEPLAATRGAERMGDAYFGIYLRAMGSGRPRSVDEVGRLLAAAGFSAPRVRATRIPLLTSVLVARPQGEPRVLPY